MMKLEYNIPSRKRGIGIIGISHLLLAKFDFETHTKFMEFPEVLKTLGKKDLRFAAVRRFLQNIF